MNGIAQNTLPDPRAMAQYRAAQALNTPRGGAKLNEAGIEKVAEDFEAFFAGTHCEQRCSGIEPDPLTGGGYRNFSDTLRDVQDMVSDPQLRAQAQQIRERASRLRGLDPAFAPFANRIDTLAQGYHSKQIVAFVARFRTENAVPPA